MNIEILTAAGAKTGRTIELPEEIFGVEPNEHVMYLAVKQYLANQRQGTHKAKNRNEVQGSSKKLHRQKGTGGSRKGNIRNPLYKGGGAIFGPRPRNYGFKLNRKVKDLAKISALSAKAQSEGLVVVEDLKFDAPKTSQFVSMMKGLGVDNKKALFVFLEPDNNVWLSSRNIPNAGNAILADIHTYEILNADVMVLTESAAKIFTDEAATEA